MEKGPLRFDRQYAPGEIDFDDPRLKQLSGLEASGTAEYNSLLEEIRVRGELRVQLAGECDRCLAAVPMSLQLPLSLLFLNEKNVEGDEEQELNDDEVETSTFAGAGVDLVEVLREQVLLALPMHWLCREDCKGLCPVCGSNRNTQPCSCVLPVEDDRWSGLQALRKS
jgi:uncharacterized protein